jgi:LemA protein
MPLGVWIAIAIAIAGALLLAVIWLVNRMISLRNRARNAFSDIDVQLKRRWDLVPALVETVKGYAAHEQDTLVATVQARDHARAVESVADRGAAEHALAGQVKSLFALAEAYPDLKANQQFLQLHRDLVEVEDKLQYARRYYNAVVRDYNSLIERFPAVLLAGVFGHKGLEFFELEDAAQRAAPKVNVDG